MHRSIPRIRPLLLGLCGLALVGVSLSASRSDGSERGTLKLADIGSFHVGGRPVTLSGHEEYDVVLSPGQAPTRVDPNGDYETGQMYAQYFTLANPRAKYPLVFLHGGGMTGTSWETTPDGRQGWNSLFLRAGYSTYVVDAVERGRASWSRWPEIYAGEALHRTKNEAWHLFRIGTVDQ